MRKHSGNIGCPLLQVDVILDKYMKHPKFKGVRNILEGEPDNWLSQESVQRGLGMHYS